MEGPLVAIQVSIDDGIGIPLYRKALVAIDVLDVAGPSTEAKEDENEIRVNAGIVPIKNA